MKSSLTVILLFISLLSYCDLLGQIKIHKHLTSANGLVNDRIKSIEQDKQGYIWIGTDDGLSKWDGNNFKNFHKNNGLSSAHIQDLAIGPDNSIYIATYGGGLNIIKNESITVFDSTNGLTTNWLLCVTILEDGTLLAGGKGGNISILKNGKFSQWISPDNLKRKDVYEIFQSKDSTYYIGTFQGGFYTLKNKELKNYSSKDGLVNENVYCFFENLDGSIYFSTNLGIHLFKDEKIDFMNKKWGRRNSSCTSIISEDNENIYFATDEGVIIKSKNKIELIGVNNGLSFNEISCLFADNYGTFYIGTYGNGIDIHHPDKLEIFNINTGLPSDKIWSIYQDEDSKFFLGTHDGLVIDANSQASILSMADYNYGNVVKRILKTKDGIIYAGTTYGINILSGNTNKKLTKDNGLIDTYIMDMVETPDKKILAATRFGVIIIENGIISSLTSKDGLIDDYILSILVSEDNTKYFGTNGKGVSVYKNSSFSALTSKNGLSDLTVNAIAQGKDGTIYFGTDQGGVNIFRDNKISVIDISSGLSSNSIRALAISDDGKVYASTNNGLNIIDFTQDIPKVRIIDAESGLPSNLCLDKSLYIDNDGDVWVGTSNGLVKYNPQKDVENKMPPKIHITSLQIYNEDIVLQDFIKSPELDYNQNYLKFDFTGINLSAPNKMKYKYRLTGIDKDWVENKNNSVQYTNLGSGSYLFEVKAMNEFGYWSEPAKLDFVVNPAFWKTWWAYLIYFVLAAVGFVAIRRYELNRVKLKNNLRLKEFESKKLQEVDQIKSRFFANISHEFRTPLTIIIGSLEKLKSKMENNSDDKELAVMKRNASRLLQLINQLLELSRIESGNAKLTASESDIVKFLIRITASFSSLATKKNQILTFNSVPVDDNQSKEEIFVFYDKKKLETVFYNLLSNAIKFSPKDEKIDVSLTKSDDYIKISFMNTGIEIPSEKINNIFDRFHQVDDTGTRNFEGTGIGLSLVKEYVELHKGKIEVESNNNITAFTILLPLGKNHLGESEIVESKEEENNILNEVKNTILSENKKDDVYVNSSSKINPNDGEQAEDKTIILIVEDNPDLREMIKENLRENYFVIEAENGKKGLKLAEEAIPDLVISDIMMPEMDGYELSNKIKTNEKTNHIPVILLTAKAATEDILAGLETGADDYLIKPFNSDELKIRVRNLIKIRKQLQEKYQAQMLIKPTDVIVPSTQKVFIDKLTSIIEINISNESFSVEIMCAQIGMSRAQLHRKVKAITNQSASEFIRNFRLQRGAELLKQDAGNIAEIAYQVGFSSQAYFTKTFQELYGQTPLEFKKLHNK